MNVRYNVTVLANAGKDSLLKMITIDECLELLKAVPKRLRRNMQPGETAV